MADSKKTLEGFRIEWLDDVDNYFEGGRITLTDTGREWMRRYTNDLAAFVVREIVPPLKEKVEDKGLTNTLNYMYNCPIREMLENAKALGVPVEE